jgi:hypothetical protein
VVRMGEVEEGLRCKRSSTNSCVGIKLSFRRYDAGQASSPLTRSCFVTQFMPSSRKFWYPLTDYAFHSLSRMQLQSLPKRSLLLRSFTLVFEQMPWHHDQTPPSSIIPVATKSPDWPYVSPQPPPLSCSRNLDFRAKEERQRYRNFDSILPCLPSNFCTPRAKPCATGRVGSEDVPTQPCIPSELP